MQFGSLDVSPLFVLKSIAVIVTFVAMITDMKWGKIYNWLTFPLILIGFSANSYFFGMQGFGISLIAAALGITFYLWFAYLGAVGMGDVKLMAAIGALGGVKFVVGAFLYTSVIGIPHALLIQYLNYGKNAGGMLLTSFVTKAFMEKSIQNDNAQLRYHYYLGVDIWLGTLLSAIFEIPLGF